MFKEIKLKYDAIFALKKKKKKNTSWHQNIFKRKKNSVAGYTSILNEWRSMHTCKVTSVMSNSLQPYGL